MLLWLRWMFIGCGLAAWGSHSQVVHATSKTLLGPYQKQSVILAPEAHNPFIQENPNATNLDHAYILWIIGNPGHGSTSNCSDLPPAARTLRSRPSGSPYYTAPSPKGPWTRHELGFGCNNPSAIRHPNGTWFVMCDTRSLYSATSITGPWSHVVDVPKHDGWEDAFLYLDIR